MESCDDPYGVLKLSANPMEHESVATGLYAAQYRIALLLRWCLWKLRVLGLGLMAVFSRLGVFLKQKARMNR